MATQRFIRQGENVHVQGKGTRRFGGMGETSNRTRAPNRRGPNASGGIEESELPQTREGGVNVDGGVKSRHAFRHTPGAIPAKLTSHETVVAKVAANNDVDTGGRKGPKHGASGVPTIETKGDHGQTFKTPSKADLGTSRAAVKVAAQAPHTVGDMGGHTKTKAHGGRNQEGHPTIHSQKSKGVTMGRHAKGREGAGAVDADIGYAGSFDQGAVGHTGSGLGKKKKPVAEY